MRFERKAQEISLGRFSRVHWLVETLLSVMVHYTRALTTSTSPICKCHGENVSKASTTKSSPTQLVAAAKHELNKNPINIISPFSCFSSRSSRRPDEGKVKLHWAHAMNQSENINRSSHKIWIPNEEEEISFASASDCDDEVNLIQAREWNRKTFLKLNSFEWKMLGKLRSSHESWWKGTKLDRFSRLSFAFVRLIGLNTLLVSIDGSYRARIVWEIQLSSTETFSNLECQSEAILWKLN